MNQSLALTVLAQNTPDGFAQLTEFLASHHCHIESSRMLLLNNTEFAMLLLIDGPWNELAKLETRLPIFATQHDLLIQLKRVAALQEETRQWIPYSAELIARDSNGIIEAVSRFFTDEGAVIYESSDNRYKTHATGIIMYSLSFHLLIPADTQLSELRERFAALCDFLNIDAYLEPERI
ncbi:MAG: hypothetical protein K2Q14_07290 [Gammaproteobacteria bacterium]|nr:hypothetical protein [Gammaproteobacteria bacterium]